MRIGVVSDIHGNLAALEAVADGLASMSSSISATARFAILTRHTAGWQADLRSVDYDFEAMAPMAERHDAPDWAHSLRTGHAPA